MVEVFKTNINNPKLANKVIKKIHQAFKDYQANFDLEDCDKILRIYCSKGNIESDELILLLNEFGFEATVLNDEPILYKN